MGSSHGHPTEYHESGKHHGDTVVYKDSDLLASAGGRDPDYITAIRVWHDDFIYGIEVFYDGVSSGIRKANSSHSAQYTDVVLGYGEHINRISGRSGDLIDHLEFHTSAGKSYQFGTSHGGKNFEQ